MPFKDPLARQAYNKDYYAKNAEARRFTERIRYHKKGGKKMNQTYRKSHLPDYAVWQAQWRQNNPEQKLILESRSRAKKKGLEHTITKEDIDWVTVCPVLGVELDYNETPHGKRSRRAKFPSLDRKDPTKGYVVGNVFVLSQRANVLKSDMTIEQVEALLKYMRS